MSSPNRLIRRQSTPESDARHTPARPSSDRGRTSLPTDFLRNSVRRMQMVCLWYALTYTLAYFPSMLWSVAEGQRSLAEETVQIAAALISIAAAFAVYFLARSGGLSTRRMLDVGLVFVIIGSFGIAMAEHWGRLGPNVEPETDLMFGLSWVCIWIILFPLFVPTSLGKTLTTGLLAATTGPLVMWLSWETYGYPLPLMHGEVTPKIVLVGLAILYFPNYLCAGTAVFASRVIHNLGRQVRRAQELGAYRLVARIGRGGMGEVWLARHRMLARPAAIKLIRPEMLGLSDPEQAETVLRRFEREAQATALLRSPHTVEVFDFGITPDGAFYYVMELLEGLDMDSLVARFGPLPPERVVHLLRQCCESLAEAHRQGLIHRDIKPANIFTCQLGTSYDFAKLLDFGLVTAEGDTEGSRHLTGDRLAAGTPAYMAPERIIKGGEIDGRADLYALGCVAYLLLTGCPVFEGKNAMELIVHHARTTPVAPSQRTETAIPDELEAIVLACLAKDPRNRPSKAEELSRRLAQIPLEEPWTAERAAEWWTLHRPVSDWQSTAKSGEQKTLAVTLDDRPAR